MTFLELCQRLADKAGITSAIPSVTNQVGELKRVVNWIAEAYEYIQNKHTDWEFLRRDVLFTAAINKATYTPAEAGVPAFGQWRFIQRWRSYRDAVGVADEQPIEYVPYDAFRDRFMFSTSRLMVGRPTVVTEAPDQSLIFWPIPDQVYIIVGEAYRSPAVMVANSDTPIFAARFHNVIVHRALMFYGEYEGDPNTFGAGQTECARVLSMMESVYLPEWHTPGPMA